SHVKKGKLGALIKLAKANAFPPGTVIVVEAWDRLGRQKPTVQIVMLQELLTTGVAIGVARTGNIYTAADIDGNRWFELSAWVKLAYDESKQKSDRLKAQRAAKRKAAVGSRNGLSGKAPWWLEKHDGRLVVPLERKAALERILTLASEGLSEERIASTMQRE